MLRLRTFGALTLVSDTTLLTGAATQRRPLALLTILAVAGESGVSRERVQVLLWPESDALHARRVLAQTLYALRRNLGDAGVILGTTDLRLNPAFITTDVGEFERRLSAGELEAAVSLYRGPFLDGVHLSDAPEFGQWVDGERRRLATAAQKAVEHLAREAMARGDAEVAAGWWNRAAALDPLSARVAVGLMEALAASGNTAAALQHARVHEVLLREELGATPDPSVVALVKRLRTPDRDRPANHRATEHLTPDAQPAGRSQPQSDALPGAEPDRATPAAWPARTADPGTSDATPTREAREPRASGDWRRAAVPAAVVLLGVFGATLMFRGERGTPAPADRSVVVVAPFDVADPELRLWREGMVDVISRDLDGAGPLRAVPPTRIVRDWQGRADRETVRAFALAHGAGTAVYGGLVRAGTDSVRASVTVLDATTGQSLVETARQEPVARMDRLTDSIAVDVLRGVGSVIAVGAARAATIGSATSLEALRAFLRGEQFLRLTQWDSAAAHYTHAVTLDSTLALAWRRLGAVTSWLRLQQDSLVAAYLLRAGAVNRGYGPRDSLLLLADSLSAAADNPPSSVAGFSLKRRLFATLDEVTRRYADDPEAWFALGEARYHFGFGPVLGVSERAALDAFDRAIALDSAFAPAYIHAVELGLNLGGAPLGLRYARAYLARNPPEGEHRGVLLIEPLVTARGSDRNGVARLLDTARTSAIVSARTILRRWPDSAETAVRLSRILAAGRPSEYALFADTSFMRRRLAEQLAVRGHLVEAARVLGERDVPLFAELAYLGAGVPSAHNVLTRWVREGLEVARLASPYWSARRDTFALQELLTRMRARATTSTDAGNASSGDARVRAAYDTASVLAHLALARGDSATALKRLLALPDTLCPECYVDRLVRARLLLAAGRAAEAVTALEEPLVAFLTPIEVVFAVERARAARASGARRVADEACRFVRAAWAHGDAGPRTTMREVCPERR